MHTCSGFGECLQQSLEIGIAYTKNTDILCEHNCQPLKCPNFAVCGDESQKWVYGCHGGRCIHCNMNFRKNLTINDTPEECPICTEVSQCVVLPNCTHRLCITCFRRCYVNGPPRVGEPPFPYPEKEDEYFETGNEHTNQLYHDPLVMKWNDDWEKWDDEWNSKYRNESNLRTCPICRA